VTKLLLPLIAMCGLLGANESLLQAVKAGDSVAVVGLLKAKADANAADPDGTTVLEWAAHRNDANMVGLLLRAGARPGNANVYHDSALSEAASNGNAAIIGELLKAGADPNLVSSEGEPPLLTATRSGNADAVQILLQHGAAVNARDGWKGQTALMWAAALNHRAVVKVLIVSGADLNARSTVWPAEVPRPANGNLVSKRPKGGLTALLYASREGALDSVRELVAGKADLNLTEPDGTNALLMAIINAHYDVAAFLLDAGANPNIADKYGRTALYAAVDMNTVDTSGTRPPPPVTDRLGPFEMISALLAHGANTNARLKEATPGRAISDDPDPTLRGGTTPFMRAAKTGDVASMRLLLKSGADPLLGSQYGTTPLMAAAGVGLDYGGNFPPEDRSLEAVKLCLELGADVNAANMNGLTALHGAAARGADRIAQLLVEKGAKLDIKDKKGRTPLDVALGKDAVKNPGYPSTAALLRKLMETAQERGAIR
jgi:uncharacterized protein